MRPGVFRHVMPWLSARPERGSTNPAQPDGTAMAMPVGTSARPPAGSRCASTAACRSYPASSGCCATGSGRSASSRRMGTCTNRQGRWSGPQVLEKLGALLLGQLHDRVIVRMVDDDAHRAGDERVDLLGRETELEIVHGRRRFLAGESVLVLGRARDRRAVLQPDRDGALDAHQLGEPFVEPLLVVDL